MSLMIVAALLGIAYFLMEAGLTFFALITFLVAILHAITTQRQAQAAAAHGAVAGAPPRQRPVIVTTTGGNIHNPMKVAIKHTWDGSDGYSDFLTYLGGALHWPFALAARIITGRPGKIAKGH